MGSSSTRIVLSAPQELCLYQPTLVDNTLGFFDRLALTVLISRENVVIDFSATTRITAAAALMLFAEVTRCQNCADLPNKAQSIRVKPPKDSKLNRIMVDSGLMDALKPGAEGKLDRLWGSNSLFNSGNNPSEQRELTRQMLDQLEGLTEVPERLRKAISEAYLNIKHHAYMNDSAQPLHPFIKDRWWQYAVLGEKDGRQTFSFLIYDKGVGIPNKVPSPAMMISREHDHVKITRAFQTGYSSTELSGRGYGSEDIIAPTEKSLKDKLLVMSNKGVVYFSGNSEPTYQIDQTYSVGGTLLEWKFVL